MKKKLLAGLATGLITLIAPHMSIANVLEWSDIAYVEGRFSRIYFDYTQGGGPQNGTFYVINDWIVNQDDGGQEGGLKSNEYNLFTFSLGSNNYEIRIYNGGNSDIFLNGTNNPNALLNFNSATSWTTSPNEPNVNHTIWEFSFDVQPTSITRFIGHDPANQTTIYNNPPPPSVITSGPSIYPHYIDGEFADVQSNSTIPPDPNRPYWDPVADPGIIPRNITLHEGGGCTSSPVPEPATMLLLGTGIAGLAGSTIRKKKK